MAKNSASRFRSKVGSSTENLVKLLVEASQNPTHELVQVICDAISIDWLEEPENREVVLTLLRLIASNLTQLDSAR